jgi:DNA-binding transcriptional ArsR family regulator
VESALPLTSARWEILRELSKGPANTTRIAQAVGTSVPNASQQLRLLLAYGLIDREREKRGAVGKPAQRYRLARPCCEVSLAAQGFARRALLHPNDQQGLLVRVLFIPKADDQLFVIKALSCADELLERCAIAYLKSTAEAIELLLLTDDVERMRAQYSSMTVACRGKERRIAGWTHSASEVVAGIRKRDAYYEHLMRDPIILHDPHHLFDEVLP